MGFIQDLKSYNKKTFLSDLSAGITVGVMLIPQGMAYAMIAGLPPIYGLYTALIPQIIYGLLGTSRQVSIGPVATDSILLAASIGALSLSNSNEYISIAIGLAFLIGIFQLAAGLLKLGIISELVSKPILNGFMSAIAIIIISSQLKHLFGISIEGNPKFYETLYLIGKNANQISYPTLLIGVIGMLVLKGLKRIHMFFPAALALIIIGIISMKFSPLQEYNIKIIGKIPSGLPSFIFPERGLKDFSELWEIAFTLALIGFLETITIGKKMQEKHTYYTIKPNRELIALGFANLIGSLFQSYPATAGFSRTAVNDQSGAKTGMAPLISALIIALTLVYLTPLFYYLPKVILGSIIILAAIKLIDIKYPKEQWKNNKLSFFIILFTFTTTLFVGISQGLFWGISLNILILLIRIIKPHFQRPLSETSFHYFNILHHTNDTHRTTFHVLQFKTPLSFLNNQLFYKEIEQIITTQNIQDILVDGSTIQFLGNSGVQGIKQLILLSRKANISIHFFNINTMYENKLLKSGTFLEKTNVHNSKQEAITCLVDND